MFCLKKTLFGNSDAYIRERSMSSLPENLQVQFNNKNGVFLRRIILSLLLGLLQLSSPSPHCCYSLHPFLALLRLVLGMEAGAGSCTSGARDFWSEEESYKAKTTGQRKNYPVLQQN